jgi:hypothetical protein
LILNYLAALALGTAMAAAALAAAVAAATATAAAIRAVMARLAAGPWCKLVQEKTANL